MRSAILILAMVLNADEQNESPLFYAFLAALTWDIAEVLVRLKGFA